MNIRKQSTQTQTQTIQTYSKQTQTKSSNLYYDTFVYKSLQEHFPIKMNHIINKIYDCNKLNIAP